MNNIDFVGNERVVEQLGKLIDANRFPHALIIEGDAGLGKLTLARLMAAALVCRDENKPCLHCAQCKKAINQIHPDIIEYSGSGASNTLSVKKVREVMNDVFMQPNEAEHKVYIFNNANSMNAAGQNALLKTLEEPPAYANFILTVPSKNMMLPTVLSRAVVVSLESVNAGVGADYIVSHNEDIAWSDAFSAVETFGGNIGRALESLGNGTNEELVKTCISICNALVSDNEYQLLTTCSSFQNDRQGIIFAGEFLKKIFRDALLFNEDIDLLSGQRETAILLKSKLTSQKLVDLIEVCDTLKAMANMNCNNALLITKICYSLRSAIGR